MNPIRKSLSQLSRNSGTLLIETLIVAMITLTLFPIVVLKTTALYQHVALTQFIHSLNAFIYEAQLKAFTEKRSISVAFNEPLHQVFTSYSISGHLDTLYAPPFIHFENGTHPLIIHFSPQGSIQQGGTLFISTSFESDQLTFLLGQGRFYVSKR